LFYLFNKIFSNFSQIERRALIGAALIFIVSLFFISVNSYYKNTVELPVRGGSYVEGLVGQPSFINPLISNMSDVDRDLIAITYSSLDDLVDKYQISEDNRSWTLILKKDLVWSDGQSLTADDIAFTVETIQDANNNHPLYSTWRGVVVERLNENEIRFTLKTPYVFLIDNFKEFDIFFFFFFYIIKDINFLGRYGN
jgi:peptide/nickel transport system substrate-binding protein